MSPFSKESLTTDNKDEKSDSVFHGESRDVESAPAETATGEIDPAIEKRVRRKLDLHVVPLLSALYLLAFLDRSNIGYVRAEKITASTASG